MVGREREKRKINDKIELCFYKRRHTHTMGDLPPLHRLARVRQLFIDGPPTSMDAEMDDDDFSLYDDEEPTLPLMKKAKNKATVLSIVAILMASRLPSVVRPKARVCTTEEWRYRLCGITVAPKMPIAM